MKIEIVGMSDRGFLLGDHYDGTYCVLSLADAANIDLEDKIALANRSTDGEIIARNETKNEGVQLCFELENAAEAQAVGFFEALGSPIKVWYSDPDNPGDRIEAIRHASV